MIPYRIHIALSEAISRSGSHGHPYSKHQHRAAGGTRVGRGNREATHALQAVFAFLEQPSMEHGGDGGQAMN